MAEEINQDGSKLANALKSEFKWGADEWKGLGSLLVIVLVGFLFFRGCIAGCRSEDDNCSREERESNPSRQLSQLSLSEKLKIFNERYALLDKHLPLLEFRAKAARNNYPRLSSQGISSRAAAGSVADLGTVINAIGAVEGVRHWVYVAFATRYRAIVQGVNNSDSMRTAFETNIDSFLESLEVSIALLVYVEKTLDEFAQPLTKSRADFLLDQATVRAEKSKTECEKLEKLYERVFWEEEENRKKAARALAEAFDEMKRRRTDKKWNMEEARKKFAKLKDSHSPAALNNELIRTLTDAQKSVILDESLKAPWDKQFQKENAQAIAALKKKYNGQYPMAHNMELADLYTSWKKKSLSTSESQMNK